MLDTAQLESFEQILNAKYDLSVERYKEGWPDLMDRYDVTAALAHGPSVLDIGCAQGLLGWLLALRRAEIKQYTGVDACAAMIEQARALYGEFQQLDFRQAYAEELPFGDSRFDTVVMGQVLEHVLDAQLAAREALRVLRLGGRLIAHVPATETEPHGNHLRVFTTVESLTDLFSRRFVNWMGWGRMHHFWYIWGEKIGEIE